MGQHGAIGIHNVPVLIHPSLIHGSHPWVAKSTVGSGWMEHQQVSVRVQFHWCFVQEAEDSWEPKRGRPAGLCGGGSSTGIVYRRLRTPGNQKAV